jgi:polyisoprenoid-binding protein YceI
VRYRLDPGAGAIYVQVYKDPDTLAAGLSHDHVIVAKGWTGTVVWTPDDLSACSIDIRVPVNSLQNDAPEWRTRVGYDTTLSESQRAEVRDHMIGSSQLDAARYPEISFRSTGCAKDGDRYTVTGALSVHGKSQTVTIRMKISGDGARFSASGTLKFKQSSFGFQPFSAMAGALKNRDEVKLVIEVSGKPE